MSDSGKTRQQRRRAGRPVLFAALAFVLAGCAAADGPMPFINTPDPETTATTPPAGETPAAASGAAANTPQVSQGDAASGNAASAPSGTRPGTHSPVRQDLPFPSFATPAQAGQRPVLNDSEKAKMQSDLEALAKSRENQMRGEIEQAQ